MDTLLQFKTSSVKIDFVGRFNFGWALEKIKIFIYPVRLVTSLVYSKGNHTII